MGKDARTGIFSQAKLFVGIVEVISAGRKYT